ncbi:DNA mismatch repair protein MutS [Rheinheimera salexigens]|uniref:Ribosome rescue factor SmrB n=1 Tax=Rheinheimera salexigens TaxID=1628148 RepID=A0A1E7QA40_9GAMM|nr:DNA mismatch repair protein MutS [Rheinheimera salexigens]
MLKASSAVSPDVTDEDSQLFRQSIAGARPITQDKIPPVAALSKQKRRADVSANTLANDLFYFSDQYEGYIDQGGSHNYVQTGDDVHLSGRLKRGEFQPQVILDLHGMTSAEAKIELAGLLAYCEQKHLNCACVVHGKGLGILARKVPNWLIQHPNVRAFHTAPKSWGKNGALLLLLKIKA